MLRNISELAKDAISKNPIISKVFSKKVFKLFLRHQILSLGATILLISLFDYCFIEKKDGKKDLIWPISLNSFKIVLILLAKIITI